MPVIARLVFAATLALSLPAAAGEFRFDRVDLVSEDTGLWLNHELPAAPAYPVRAALRFVTQVKVVFALPGLEGLQAGASLSSQSIALERPLELGFLPKGFAWHAGVQTRWLMPRGAFGGVAYRWKHLRVSAGVSALSGASWAHPTWSSWTVVPTLGIGIGRALSVN